MIGVEEPMELVIVDSQRNIVRVIHLGFQTLESGEMDRVEQLLKAKNLHGELMEAEETLGFGSLMDSLREMIK